MAHGVEHVAGKDYSHALAGGFRHGVDCPEREIHLAHESFHALYFALPAVYEMRGYFYLQLEIEEVRGAARLVVHVVANAQKEVVGVHDALKLHERKLAPPDELADVAAPEIEARFPLHGLEVADRRCRF